MKDNEFEKRNEEFIKLMNADNQLRELSLSWFAHTLKYEYSYHFRWLGRPIIQYPSDIIAIQEIIWRAKPDLVIETGIARGGSLIFYASMLELIGFGEVLGIDIDLREQNKVEIEKHPIHNRITMMEGSSVDNNIVEKVHEFAKGKKNIIVILDSNHTHNHVLKEMCLYSDLVKMGGYMIVFDTIIEEMPENFYTDVINRPWGKGNNPKTAVEEFLQKNERFEVDTDIEKKLLISSAPGGYLKCIK